MRVQIKERVFHVGDVGSAKGLWLVETDGQ